MRRRLRLLVVLLAVGFFAGCVNIQTGSETPDQLEESAANRGKDFRVTWVNRFTGATPVEKADMLRDLVDSLSANYLRYGYKVAGDWRSGNEVRGQLIADSEIRDIIDRSNQSQQPLMKAYEDVMEYSLQQIKDSKFFGASTVTLMQDHIDQFYDVNSAVFYPSGTVDDYEYRLDGAKKAAESVSRELGLEVDGYR